MELGGNNIGDEGAAALAQGLRNNTALTTLYLHDNDIGDDGAAALALTLRNNTALTTLKLQGNDIGATACTEVTNAAREGVSVRC